MPTYIPNAFAGNATDARRLIEAHPFAVLLTPDADGPQISHLPLLWADRDGGGVLCGHLARANPHAQCLTSRESVAIFRGPHAYVSPSWYAEPEHQVPTWNYVVAHVHGEVRLLDDAAAESTLRMLEYRLEGRDRNGMDPSRRTALRSAIVAFELIPGRIETKLKLSQNKSEADRAGVIAGLEAAQEEALLKWMRP